MTFVDTNVFMYAVGNPHPLKSRAYDFFNESLRTFRSLYTSAEVLQELAHAYLPARRYDVFEDAAALIERAGVEVWPLEDADVMLARQLHHRHPELSVRDLCHLASCQRRGVRDVMTFDQALAAAGSTLAKNPDGM